MFIIGIIVYYSGIKNLRMTKDLARRPRRAFSPLSIDRVADWSMDTGSFIDAASLYHPSIDACSKQTSVDNYNVKDIRNSLFAKKIARLFATNKKLYWKSKHGGEGSMMSGAT